jgi:hypothetical protein
MREYPGFKSAEDLPEAVKRKLGIGRFKAKVFRRSEGELIAKATQDIDGIVIKLMYIRREKANSGELTEKELNRVMLMAKDLRRMT